jgi:MraZ protein
MMMGEYAHALDDKGRIIVPARLREDLRDRFVMTKGLDGCLFLYPLEEWSRIVARLKELPLSSSNARAFTRLFLAGAQEVECDRQGRVTIPPRLREHAAIQRNVVLVGVMTRAELWAEERWRSYQAQGQQGFDAVAGTLGEFGF